MSCHLSSVLCVPKVSHKKSRIAMTKHVDILVLGSGFGGSLLAAIARKLGKSVVLIDRKSHPRFAVGESSTPLADQLLSELANQYDLKELQPLASFGTWQTAMPDLLCGPKQGFSYFGHCSEGNSDAAQQLLVIARDTTAHSDTHWLRSDVDQAFFHVTQSLGTHTLENASYELLQSPAGWKCSGVSEGTHFRVEAPFVVDATGRSAEVLRCLGIRNSEERLRTRSHAVFAHFANVRTVADVLDRNLTPRDHHPFPCDDAAVHHVFDDGWMWQLRFRDDTISAGIMSTCEYSDPEKHWHTVIDRHPFLRQQFEHAEIIRPGNSLVAAGRVQRCYEKAAGASWVALPSAVGFVDPLHSTGIAHTLYAIRRIANIWQQPALEQSLAWSRYSDKLIDELLHIDRLVEGCYAALPSFRLWSDWCMLYFAAVTCTESLVGSRDEDSFLRASDKSLCLMIEQARELLQECLHAGSTDDACGKFEQQLRRILKPWNTVELLDPQKRGMYCTTACPYTDPRATNG